MAECAAPGRTFEPTRDDLLRIMVMYAQNGSEWFGCRDENCPDFTTKEVEGGHVVLMHHEHEPEE